MQGFNVVMERGLVPVGTERSGYGSQTDQSMESCYGLGQLCYSHSLSEDEACGSSKSEQSECLGE